MGNKALVHESMHNFFFAKWMHFNVIFSKKRNMRYVGLWKRVIQGYPSTA
jgi:hypothetical protein